MKIEIRTLNKLHLFYIHYKPSIYTKKSFSIFAIKKFLLNFIMKTVTVTMNEQELKRFESFKEAEKIVRGIKRGLREINKAKAGNTQLKSARQLANEI